MKTSLPLFEQGETRELAKARCREVGISIVMLEDLIEAELGQQGKKTRVGLFQSFDEILLEEVD